MNSILRSDEQMSTKESCGCCGCIAFILLACFCGIVGGRVACMIVENLRKI